MATEAAAFFTEYGESNRYTILEVIGKGSYGVVASALDNTTGARNPLRQQPAQPRERSRRRDRRARRHQKDKRRVRARFGAQLTRVVAGTRSRLLGRVTPQDATRILREIKLLRQLKHPDIVEIKHILLPPHPREFRDIYVVFELLETDLHQVIKANDDLTPEHHQFFLYQMLRGLKYVHSGACNGVTDAAGWTAGSQSSGTAPPRGRTHAAAACGAANVFHRDLKPKNILANSDCKLKARVVPAAPQSQLLTLVSARCDRFATLVSRARRSRTRPPLSSGRIMLQHGGTAHPSCAAASSRRCGIRSLPSPQAWLTRAARPPVRAVLEDD